MKPRIYTDYLAEKRDRLHRLILELSAGHLDAPDALRVLREVEQLAKAISQEAGQLAYFVRQDLLRTADEEMGDARP